MTPRRFLIPLLALVGLLGPAAPTVAQTAPEADRPALAGPSNHADADAPPEESVNIKIQLSGARDAAELLRVDGGYRYRITHQDGSVDLLTPAQFAARVYADHTRRGWWGILLNISSPIGIAWVAVGLLGQLLFTGRMVVQWLVSEKEKRSVVPPVFWWMSLTGATMLLIYFLWRKDIVGVLGQGTGWAIYIRNLWLIYRPRRAPTYLSDPAPEPELE